MDKEAEVHIYIHVYICIYRILLGHKRNTFESVLMTYVKLEAIIQSEISQKEKNKHCILTRIYGI